MSLKTLECKKCGQTIYETGEMVTTRDGTEFPQRYNDKEGTQVHYKNCPGRKSQGNQGGGGGGGTGAGGLSHEQMQELLKPILIRLNSIEDKLSKTEGDTIAGAVRKIKDMVEAM